MGDRTRTSWSGCLLLVQTVVQTRAARGGLQHRSRWHDATRGRRGWRGSDDSRLVCLTCCLLVARATFRVAALAEAKTVAVERRLAHCEKPSAAFLSRGEDDGDDGEESKRYGAIRAVSKLAAAGALDKNKDGGRPANNGAQSWRRIRRDDGRRRRGVGKQQQQTRRRRLPARRGIMRSVSSVSARRWHECALPATACDHECRTSCWRVRRRRRDLLQD